MKIEDAMTKKVICADEADLTVVAAQRITQICRVRKVPGKKKRVP